MNKLIKAILLVVICTALTSFGQIFLKYAANNLKLESLTTLIVSAITTWQLYIGVLIYFLAAALLIIAFKFADLSVAYPIIATSYIWVALLSRYFFNEILTSKNWLGILFILVGVSLTGFGGRK